MQEQYPERMEQLMAAQQGQGQPQEGPSQEEQMMMQQQMQQGAPQGGMPQGQPSPEEMAMMQQQGGQGQPPMMTNGGNVYQNGNYMPSYENLQEIGKFGENAQAAATRNAYDSAFDNANDAPKVYSNTQTLGNKMGQLAPMAANIGMGLFAKEGNLDLDKLTNVTFNRENNREELKDIDQTGAGYRKLLQNSANAPQMLTGVQMLHNNEQKAKGISNENLRKTNAQIDNQEKLANLKVKFQNLQQTNAETAYEKKAKAAKSAQLMRGIDQLAEYNRAQQEDEIALQYANMGHPDFRYEYNSPFDKYNEKRKNKKNEDQSA